MHNLSPNQPFYMYRCPMFLVTVSVVIFEENGVIIAGENYSFPNGIVKAGLESIQFSAIRIVKEEVGIILKKNDLIPVDFRSDPDRSLEKNIIDFGFAYIIDKQMDIKNKYVWKEVDFETETIIDNKTFFMDHGVLLQRAINVVKLMRE